MSSQYKFVKTDTDELVSEVIAAYEKIVGITVHPASPEQLFCVWVANIMLHFLERVNYAANQNLPSRASGKDLDALGELFYDSKRPEAVAATCKMEVRISKPQETSILIPKGTRFTDASSTLVWDVLEDAYIPVGDTSAEVRILCETAGSIGNGYFPGQINTLVDISDIPYYLSCGNTTISDGGAERANDKTYYERLRASEDAYSVAGPMGAYVYLAKSVSTKIADVKAIRPTEVRKKTLTVYADHAFLGGEHLQETTLKVHAAGAAEDAVPDVDYSFSYEDNLLTIALAPEGALSGATNIDVEIVSEMAGHVHIYALMDDGSIASQTIKDLIYERCNDDMARPMTDYVSMKDPVESTYNINLTYYVQRETDVSSVDMEKAVDEAVKQYIKWQSEKMGRDINPAKLNDMLMHTGIKRPVIVEPIFTPLSNGKDGRTPEIAKIGTVTVVNGGYEDE